MAASRQVSSLATKRDSWHNKIVGRELVGRITTGGVLRPSFFTRAARSRLCSAQTIVGKLFSGRQRIVPTQKPTICCVFDQILKDLVCGQLTTTLR